MKIQKCYIHSLKASLPTIYCIILPALVLHLWTERAACLTFTRQDECLGWTLSLNKAQNSPSLLVLHLLLQNNWNFSLSQYFICYYLLENWPSKTWRPPHRWAGICVHHTSAQHLSPHCCALHPWLHIRLDPCNDPALPLPPDSCPLQPATCSTLFFFFF